MHRLAPALLLLTAATPALAQAPRETVAVDPASPRPFERSRPANCPGPVLQHTRRTATTGVQPLSELPPAWRIHAVERTVDQCAVHPEAQPVSDRTGQLSAPRQDRAHPARTAAGPTPANR